MLHNPTQNKNRNRSRRKKCSFLTSVFWLMLRRAPLWLLPASPHLCHIGCDWDHWPQRLINHHQHWPVRMPSITLLWAVCYGLFTAVCPHSNIVMHKQVPGIYYIWMETIRIMMINIVIPSVCFVPSITIVELIHWSFLRGFGEGVQQKTEYFWDTGGIYKFSVVSALIFNLFVLII